MRAIQVMEVLLRGVGAESCSNEGLFGLGCQDAILECGRGGLTVVS